MLVHEIPLLQALFAGSNNLVGGTTAADRNVISAGGSVWSIMPVPSSLTWIPLPRVSESLATVLGG